MTGLDKITEKIIAEAKADAAKTREEAEAAAAKTTAEYAARAEEIRARIASQAQREGENIVTRAASGTAMTKRNVILAAKGNLIDEAFTEAGKSLRAMETAKYQAMLVSLLRRAVAEQTESERTSRELYGEDEDAPCVSQYEVLMNAADRDRYGKAVVEAVRASAEGKAGKPLVLSAKEAKIDGGFLLRYGDMESNCSLSMLIGVRRNEREAQVSHILFDED